MHNTLHTAEDADIISITRKGERRCFSFEYCVDTVAQEVEEY